ncbi:uncharacterized protein LOC144477677 [Augochlora pura]
MDDIEVAERKDSDFDSDPCEDEKPPITTTTKNALITTQLGPCDVYPHRVKVSIVGIGKVGMACAIAILMKVSIAADHGLKAGGQARRSQRSINRLIPRDL